MLLCVTFTGKALQAQKFFNLTYEQVKIDSVLPYFTYTLPLGAHYQDSVYTVKLSYPEFIDMSSKDIQRYRALSGSILPEMPAITQQIVFDRKRPALQISFSPLALRNNRHQQLVSFMLDIKATAVRRPQKLASTRAGSSVSSRYANKSVLSSGRWAKIRVSHTGVHQLTDALIRRAGFTDASKVKIYGYGGWLQNERLNEADLKAYDDLKEVPTCMVNGKRLFYARGTMSWNAQNATQRTRNPYSDYGYYFLTQSETAPQMVDSTAFLSSFYPSFNDYHSLYEVDDFAWFEGGRNLFDAHPISAGMERTYRLSAPAHVSQAQLTVITTAASQSELAILCNGVEIGRQSFSWNAAKNGPDEFRKGKDAVLTTNISNVQASNEIKISVASGGAVRLDYIALTFPQPFPAPHLASDAFPAPEYVYNITNQNLHADEACDMLIIIPTSQKLLAQAQRLKAFREQHDNLRVRIIPADELYNEFSSGTPDANAYRRYLKMLYDRAGNDQTQMPRYLLLFGDCAFDNRMNTAEWRTQNPDDYLLCFESENSFHKVYCYVDDGFFCLLDDGEGANPLSSDKPDMAVGRFPVRNAQEAKVMVDKTIAYATNHNAGDWQNTLLFMGDDGNYNLHMQDAEDAARMVDTSYPGYITKKIMWDAYKRETSAQGNTYPDVTKAIKQQQTEGALIMDYVGHGVEYQISHENVLRLNDFAEFKNANLPLWITASCDIMPFDGTVANIGESALLNPQGGAVAFFGTTRTVYANYNKRINMSFLRYVLGNDAAGNPISVGEAQRLAKNEMITNGYDLTANKLQYALLGDPALVLNRPTLKIKVDEINGVPCSSATPIAMKAGEVNTVKGHIEGAIDFNGRITLLVRDAEETIRGRMNDKSETTTPFTYQDRTRVLFNGIDSIRNGQFNFSFAVPKDISHTTEKGLINLYAVNSSHTLSGNGSEDNFILEGGSALSNDSIGPSIYCYLNSPAFVDGGNVNTTPLFVAHLADDNGINVSGNSIGHNLQLTIDGDMNKTYNLNSAFAYDFGSYTKGTAFFSLPELAPGLHKLRIKAWDVLNNSSTTELSFNVVKGLAPALFDINSTQNPARTHTTFIVQHDRAGSRVEIAIELFDSNGRLLWRRTESTIPPTNTYTADWDLTSSQGHALPTGVYLYRVSISGEGGNQVSRAKKLIIAKQ